MLQKSYKDQFKELEAKTVKAKQDFHFSRTDMADFFMKYMLDTRLLAKYIWEPIGVDLSSEFDHAVTGIQTVENSAPYVVIKELDKTFFSIAGLFDYSNDFFFIPSGWSGKIKLRLECNDHKIKIRSLDSYTDGVICPHIKLFIDGQKLSINTDFLRQKGNYLNSLEKALTK
jgi:hypothetical protein